MAGDYTFQVAAPVCANIPNNSIAIYKSDGTVYNPSTDIILPTDTITLMLRFDAWVGVHIGLHVVGEYGLSQSPVIDSSGCATQTLLASSIFYPGTHKLQAVVGGTYSNIVTVCISSAWACETPLSGYSVDGCGHKQLDATCIPPPPTLNVTVLGNKATFDITFTTSSAFDAVLTVMNTDTNTQAYTYTTKVTTTQTITLQPGNYRAQLMWMYNNTLFMESLQADTMFTIETPVCTSMPDNSITVSSDQISLGDTINIAGRFSGNPGATVTLYTNNPKPIATMTLDGYGCGTTTYKPPDTGNVYIQGYILGTNVYSETVRVVVVSPPKHYSKDYSTKFEWSYKQEGWTINIPYILNSDEGWNGILFLIEKIEYISGNTLLHIRADSKFVQNGKTNIPGVTANGFEYNITIEYSHPKISTQSMQPQIFVSFYEFLVAHPEILAAIAILVLAAIVFKYAKDIETAIIAAAILGLALLYKDRDVKSLYSKR